MTSFAILYSILELGMNWNPSINLVPSLHIRYAFTAIFSLYFYRLLYLLIFMYPSYFSSGKLLSLETVWYLVYGSLIEDISYWVIGLGIPFSWVWFYPVYYGIPIDDVIESVFLLILYKIVQNKQLYDKLLFLISKRRKEDKRDKTKY